MPFNGADYIAVRLRQQGVTHLFGVVGVPCAEVFAAATRNGIMVVATATDMEAGYAADGYARLTGLGAVSVSYGVGTLSISNPIAGAYVERSPIVVINGGPNPANLLNMRRFGVPFSHSIGREKTDLEVFQKITQDCFFSDSIVDLPKTVDQAFSTAIRSNRPVYLEIAKNVFYDECVPPTSDLTTKPEPVGTEGSLADEIMEILQKSHRPALLLGEEIQRLRLSITTGYIIDRLGIPWVTTLLGKSVLSEQRPGFVGVYDGRSASEQVLNVLYNSDAILALGCGFSTGQTALVAEKFGVTVHAYDGWVRQGERPPVRGDLKALVEALATAHIIGAEEAVGMKSNRETLNAETRNRWADLVATTQLTHELVFLEINDFLENSKASWLVIPDTFLGVYPAAELKVKGENSFLCNSVWASIGYSVASAIGAGCASNRRPLVICGDGGFRMTMQALGTMARLGIRSLVIMIDNGMYGIEQYLLDPTFFNDKTKSPLAYATFESWDYVAIATALGVRIALKVHTQSELRDALRVAEGAAGPVFLSVGVDPRDLPNELRNQISFRGETKAET